jgi:endonuclease YncB( thermonuclease family)
MARGLSSDFPGGAIRHPGRPPVADRSDPAANCPLRRHETVYFGDDPGRTRTKHVHNFTSRKGALAGGLLDDRPFHFVEWFVVFVKRFQTRFVLCCAAVVLLLASCARNADYTPSYHGALRVERAEVVVEDGDTFFLNDKPVRLLGADTPEIAHPSVGFHEPQPYGPEAAESARVWFDRAEVIEFALDGKDRYGRRLGHVFLDGKLLSVTLIEHGLAYENVTPFGDNGFPDLAQQILDASKTAPLPPFEPPYQWRRKHRGKPAASQ